MGYELTKIPTNPRFRHHLAKSRTRTSYANNISVIKQQMTRYLKEDMLIINENLYLY